MDVSGHIRLFEQEMNRRGLAKSTVKSYTTDARIFFEQSKSDHPKNVYEQELRDFLSQFDEPNTQRAYHSAIKKFFEICMHQPNKFRYIPYAKQSKKLPIVLSVDEIQKMFNVCDNLKHKTILAILYATGIRASEAINLQWSHLDRSRKVINIIQAKGKKDRQVPLPDSIIHLLESYWRQYRSHPYVFSGQATNGIVRPQYSKRSILEVVKQLAIKAGIEKRVYTHLIRHCTGTHMLESGTDLRMIQEIFGHESLKTTNIYCHISSNHVAKVNSPINAIDIHEMEKPTKQVMLPIRQSQASAA